VCVQTHIGRMFVVFRLKTVPTAAVFRNVYDADVILCRLCGCETSGFLHIW